jgi:Acetyltransferase (GNAT) domain
MPGDLVAAMATGLAEMQPGAATGRGYASREYALSFAEEGMVLTLPGSGGNLLLRTVPGSINRDATGCYPLFSCNWRALADDLEQLPDGLVSLACVAEPFCPLSEDDLRQMFRIVRPLGQHYIVDLTTSAALSPRRHHRRKLRRAASDVVVDIVERPVALLDAWLQLYGTLAQRHSIRGRRRFSPAIFAAQFAVPGAVVFCARRSGRLLGADWYFEDGERVFAHLSAYSDEGYACSVSYPMLAAAIEHFSATASVLDLGGTPSVSASDPAGLAAFKAGWATRTLPPYLCGIDLMPGEYCRLSNGRPASDADFFPYYRRGEY